jgi:hypothetical protein
MRRQRKRYPATLTKHLELDHRTGLLDVAVLDVLSQAEFLLSRAREIQRQILLVRGVGSPVAMVRRRRAAQTVRKLAAEMRRESRQLTPVLEQLQRSASLLQRAVE